MPKLLKLTQEAIEKKLNRYITCKKIELVIKNFPQRKAQKPGGFISEFTEYLKKN